MGLIFLRYADHKFAIAEKELAGKGSGRQRIGKEEYQAKGVMYLPPPDLQVRQYNCRTNVVLWLCRTQ